MITRRRVLASLGVSGAAVAGGVGGLAMATEPAVAHTTETAGNNLLFKWVETYNGDKLEDSGTEARSDPPGMTISLGDIKPGDSGVLGIEMTLQSAEETDPSVAPYFALNLTETAENGRNEPERTAGDTTANEGELQDWVDVEIWYDTGAMDMGFETLGGSNLDKERMENFVEYNEKDATGTLAEVANLLPDSTTGNDPLQLETTGGECLTTDNAVKIAFRWEFTNIDDPEINVTQTDSVKFDLIFRGEDGCGTDTTT